jgi:hypothetical protein
MLYQPDRYKISVKSTQRYCSYEQWQFFYSHNQNGIYINLQIVESQDITFSKFEETAEHFNN